MATLSLREPHYGERLLRSYRVVWPAMCRLFGGWHIIEQRTFRTTQNSQHAFLRQAIRHFITSSLRAFGEEFKAKRRIEFQRDFIAFKRRKKSDVRRNGEMMRSLSLLIERFANHCLISLPIRRQRLKRVNLYRSSPL